MSEEIEEGLKKYYKNVIVEYDSLKTYKITIVLQGNIKTGIIKTILIFYYKWQDNSTFSANIEMIKYSIDKILEGEC